MFQHTNHNKACSGAFALMTVPITIGKTTISTLKYIILQFQLVFTEQFE